MSIDYSEHIKASTGIAKILKKAKISNWEKVAILEMLKTDIILNTGMVGIDGNALKRHTDNHKAPLGICKQTKKDYNKKIVKLK